MIHILLPALGSRQEVAFEEPLEVEPEPGGGYRLLHSPAFVGGIAAGDVIQLNKTEPRGFDILRRGRMFALLVSIRSNPDLETGVIPSIVSWVVAAGGSFGGQAGPIRVFSIPANAGFDSICAQLDQLTIALAPNSWWFGNAWDEHGRPLEGGWWINI